MRENFWLWIYPFQVILSDFGFCGRKPAPRMRENFLTLDLSISGEFEQVCFLWQKSPTPTPRMREIFWLWIYPFQVILSKFGFCGRKAPPPPQEEGKFFDFGSIHFRRFWAKFGFCGRKDPPLRMRENFLTLDLSISGDFDQLCFLWQKSPPSFLPFGWDTRLMLQHMT